MDSKIGRPSSQNDEGHSLLNMYWILPWEIRQRIRTFFVEGAYDNEVMVRRKGKGNFTFLVRDSTGPLSYNWIEDPTLIQLSPDRVGVDASKEILQEYYKTRIFKLSHDELECIPILLETACFSLTIRPAEHIRRLHLQFQPFGYARLLDSTLIARENSRFRQALRSLAVLDSSKTIIEVHLYMPQDVVNSEERDGLIDDTASFVFQLVQLVNTLKVTGVNISLLIEGGWDERGGVRMCSDSIASLNDCETQLKLLAA
jgi:hypothetical protein